MSSPKQVRLRAFEITNPSATAEYSDLFVKLYDRLMHSENVNDRRMSLNDTDDANQEQDIISYYDKNTKPDAPIFCTLLRVALGDNVQHISPDLFKKATFTLKELEETKLGTEAIYKRHYYFMAYKNHVVTTLPGNITIKGLQTYLSWYLDGLYELNPKIDSTKISELSNIENIKVVDPVQKTSAASENETSGEKKQFGSFTKSLRNLSKKLLKDFLQDAPDLKEEELDQMVSAELILKFRKPRESDSDELKRAYSALLKPVSDIENYQIKRRNGSPICSGQDIIEMKTISIELLESGAINEKQLEQEMRRYILELESNG